MDMPDAIPTTENNESTTPAPESPVPEPEPEEPISQPIQENESPISNSDGIISEPNELPSDSDDETDIKEPKKSKGLLYGIRKAIKKGYNEIAKQWNRA